MSGISNEQRKAIFAILEEKRKVKIATVDATKKLKDWEINKGD